MMYRVPPAWQERRSRFNHNWLKNQFLPALESFHNALKGQLERADLDRSFLEVDLPQWESQRAEAYALAADFVRDMSPWTLFDQAPLARYDEETKKWLGDVVHALWMARYPVHHWVDEASARVRNVDAAYNCLQATLRTCPDTWTAAKLLPVVNNFRLACHCLAKAIEQFPSTVRVT